MHLLDLVLPTRCLACGQWTEVDELGLCRRCAGRLRRPGEDRCRLCGVSLPTGCSKVAGRRCGSCLRRPPIHEALHFLYSYEAPLDRVIQALKFRGLPHLGEVLGRRLWDRHAEDLRHCDLVVPIPLPPWRRLQRGYNQAEVIARALARDLEKPVVQPLRRRHGSPQSAQPSTARRRRNIRRSLALRRRAGRQVRGRRVLIVDDVTTSGATLSRACALLRRAGARGLEIAVAARRPDPAASGGQR